MSNDSRHERDINAVTKDSSLLRWIGAAGIVAVAVARCVIVVLPMVVFDTDPAQDRTLLVASLGMGGSLLLDAMLILACLVALIGEWRAGRGLDPLLLVLALLPLPVVMWHGSGAGGDMWRGSTWLAAAVACATVAHLARERSMRIALTATLLAVIVPLLVRGATQVTWEHDAMIAAYHEAKPDILQSHGWEADSPAARMYERRLMHREPIGWFPSTNIYGSLAGCAMVMFIALAFAAIRAGMQSGWWFLMLLLAGACAAGLWMTTSMGALLATLGGLAAFGIIAWLLRRAPPARAGIVGWLLILMIVGAIAGVFVRGALLPEGFAHDRSLLFRWQYLRAAAGIIAEHPLLGVGPDGFQAAYTQHRVPRNPEEVQSAHSVFVDWLATLGVFGAAWAALVITLALRTGRAISQAASFEPRAEQGSTSGAGRHSWRLAMVVAGLALVPAIVIEAPALVAADVAVRALGIIGYVVIAAFIATILSTADDRWLRGMVAAAVAVLLVHGQIELTFHSGGSVAWTMCMVGLLGEARSLRAAIVSTLGALATALALMITAGWIVLRGVLPAMSQERTMLDAARVLDPLREHPRDAPTALRQRPLAAEKLVEAYDCWPVSVLPLNAATDQLLRATAATTAPPLGLLIRAQEIIDRAVADHRKPASIVLAMNVHAALAAVTDDAQERQRTIALGRRMTEIDPLGVSSWQRLGEALWVAGQRSEAIDAFRTALANDANFALDELKQLSPAERSRLRARIAETSSTPH